QGAVDAGGGHLQHVRRGAHDVGLVEQSGRGLAQPGDVVEADPVVAVHDDPDEAAAARGPHVDLLKVEPRPLHRRGQQAGQLGDGGVAPRTRRGGPARAAAVAGLPAPVPSAPPLSASTGGLDAHGTLPLCPLLSVTSAAPPAARASPLLRRHLKTIDRRAPRRFFGRLTGAADMECLSWPDGRVRGPGPQRAATTTPSGEETPLPKAVPRMPGTVSRRALLRRGAVLGGAALLPPWTAGCTPETVMHEDVPVLAGAIASEQNLIASYEAVLSAQPSLAARLDPVLARHR